MKTVVRLLNLAFVLSLAILFTGCKEDEEDPNAWGPADVVAGVYRGTLSSLGHLYTENYVVSVSKVSSNVVRVTAGFFPEEDGESAEFTLEEQDGRVVFSSEKWRQMSMFVSNAVLYITYRTVGRESVSFTGEKM